MEVSNHTRVHLIKQIRETIESDNINYKQKIDVAVVLGILSRKSEYTKLIARYPGVLDSLAKAALTSNGDNVKLEMAKVFCNLSWDIENQTILGESKKILDALFFLNSEEAYETRIFASMAIQQLSSIAQNKNVLVSYRRGLLVENLLKVARKSILKKSSFAAVQALMHLIDRETTPSLVCISEFLPTLTILSTTCLIGKFYDSEQH